MGMTEERHKGDITNDQYHSNDHYAGPHQPVGSLFNNQKSNASA